MSSSCQSIATAASSAATTAAAVSISASNATSVGSLIAAACQQQQSQSQSQQQHYHTTHQQPSHYVNGTGSLGRLKFHKSLDASDEEIEYAQVCQVQVAEAPSVQLNCKGLEMNWIVPHTESR